MNAKRTAINRLIVLLLTMASQPSVADAAVQFGGDVTIGTDYVFHGVSQTMSSPTIQATVEFESDKGWYGYLWASNVDFTPAGTADDGAKSEINAELGYGFPLSARVYASLGGVYYAFPRTLPGYDYDYGEWLASIVVDDRHRLGLAFSDNAFGSGKSGTVVTAGTSLDISDAIALDVTIGHYDLQRAYGHSYQYAEIGTSGQMKQVDWRIGYIVTAGDDTELFDASNVGERIVLSLSFSF